MLKVEYFLKDSLDELAAYMQKIKKTFRSKLLWREGEIKWHSSSGFLLKPKQQDIWRVSQSGKGPQRDQIDRGHFVN